MAKTPRGYRKELREVFVKKDADLSASREHDGLNSALARNRERDLSHALIGDRVEQRPDRSRRAAPESDRERRTETPQESAPDISGLVPLALVAVAGIAVGAVGIKAAQEARKRRQSAQVDRVTARPASAAPAGWYEVAGEASRLRYWTGHGWTDDYAERAVSAPRVVADWYPDPSNASQLRFWDGTAWTHHVSPAPGAVATPADWYPDPSNSAQLRYWDGNSWTSHIAHGSAAVGVRVERQGTTAASELAPAAEPKLNMSSAEWKAHVEAWLRAGAIQQELWRRLSNARIRDADDATLIAQRRMESLSAEQGAAQIQRMIEANPAMREQGSLLDLMSVFEGVPRTTLGVETGRQRQIPG